MMHYLRLRLAYNHYAITHANNAANTHAQDSDRQVGSSQKSNSLVKGNQTIITLIAAYIFQKVFVFSLPILPHR